MGQSPYSPDLRPNRPIPVRKKKLRGQPTYIGQSARFLITTQEHVFFVM